MKEIGFDTAEALGKIATSGVIAAKQDEVKDYMPVLLTVFVNVLFFLALLTLMFREIPATSRDVILILMGALVAGWKDVYGYYLGSSSGSEKKNQTIENLTK